LYCLKFSINTNVIGHVKSPDFICNRGFSFNKWIKRYFQIKLEDETYVTVDDLAELQKHIRRFHEEIEILKEAMAIFARK
jgi:hypothetical protein